MTRVALVTGGASGIGAAISRRLVADGCEVIVHKKSSQLEVAGTLGALPGDFRDMSSIQELFRQALKLGGRLDILVNNAGVYPKKTPTWAFSHKDWGDTLQVNFLAAAELCALAVPAMREVGGGRIVNIASTAVRMSSPGAAMYASSKAALIQFTRTLSKEVGRFGITANTVSPGFTMSPMGIRAMAHKRSRSEQEAAEFLRSYPLGRVCDPDEIASLVAFLVGPEGGAITGQDYVINCGDRIETFNFPEKLFSM